MWEIINWLVEMIAKCEMSEGMWEVINWLVEMISKCEMSERLWEIINRTRKITYW